MDAKNGWWTLNTTIEPNEVDLEYIAEKIKEGYTEGEIVQEQNDTE